MKWAIAILVVLTTALPAQAQLRDRPSYIGRLLVAVKNMGEPQRNALVQKLRIGARQKCRAAFSSPDVKCVLQMARELCAAVAKPNRAACRLVADVAVSNFLAEREWVDKKTRVTIMNESDDFSAGMTIELRARYAGLVAELSMMRGLKTTSGLSTSIDRFCVGRAKRSVLTWSRCVAAIVWYIAAPPQPNATAKESGRD